MKTTFYIVLLLCVYCVHGKNLPSSNGSLSSTVPPSIGTCVRDKSPVITMVQKPKLVVTFLANTKTLDPSSPNSNTDFSPPFFMDPFQRLLQFFFSSFVRDFNRVVGEDDPPPSTPSGHNASVTVGGGEDLLGCEHDANGYCRACHPLSNKLRRNASNNKTTIVTTSAPSSTGSGSSTTHTISSSSKPLEKPKHKRHYFLSISGGTDPRATAHNQQSEDMMPVRRMRRNASAPALNGDAQAPSIFKILEESIFETLNKDKDEIAPQKVNKAKLSRFPKLAANESTDETQKGDVDYITPKPLIDEVTEPSNDTSTEEREDDDEEKANRFDFDALPHEAEYSRGWTYFLVVTLPVVCTFAVVVLFLCVFLRTRGWCCQLFLSDPVKNIRGSSGRSRTDRRSARGAHSPDNDKLLLAK